VPNLPNVLLVGDSISLGYFGAVTEGLKGIANVYLFASSACSGDARLEEQLREYFRMVGVRFSVIHFNNGMHGWGYGEQQYAAGLPDLIATLRTWAPGAKLIWTSTTPVLHDSTVNHATNARIEARNKLAAEVVSREGISIDDQHELMLQHQELHDGDIHFTASGSAIQAKQVSTIIRGSLHEP